jgi:Flp pilus assembly protein TadG
MSLVFIMFVVGMIEVGRGLHLRNQLSYALDRGLRLVYLNSSPSDDTIISTVKQNFSVSNSADLSTTVVAETLDGRSYKLVTSTYPFKLLIPSMTTSVISLTVKRRIAL